jgi:hypothetical protein
MPKYDLRPLRGVAGAGSGTLPFLRAEDSAAHLLRSAGSALQGLGFLRY